MLSLAVEWGDAMPALKEELKGFIGQKRKFLLYRIADMETAVARRLVSVSLSTYNTWLHNREFVNIYRRRDELAVAHKLEAIQMLRQDNQLSAVILEAEIMDKLGEELRTGHYVLLKTNLAREVYHEAMTDLNITPPTPALTWQQRINQMIIGIRGNQVSGEPETPQIPEGQVIEGVVVHEDS